MKTETAKIENFTNIEAIKDKLKKEVTSLRDELKEYKRNLLEEQERIDEEKMSRLELEEQLSEMRKGIKTENVEAAKLKLAQVGEESALEELLPQIDELATLTSVLQNKGRFKIYFRDFFSLMFASGRTLVHLSVKNRRGEQCSLESSLTRLNLLT